MAVKAQLRYNREVHGSNPAQRIRDDYGKFYFNILDYTGSATRLFADPAFDGEPVVIEEEDAGTIADELLPDDIGQPPRKYYVSDGAVEIVAHIVHELDADGKQLRVVKFKDYTAEKVRGMFPSAAELRSKWTGAQEWAAIIARKDGARDIATTNSPLRSARHVGADAGRKGASTGSNTLPKGKNRAVRLACRDLRHSPYRNTGPTIRSQLPQFDRLAPKTSSPWRTHTALYPNTRGRFGRSGPFWA